MDDPKAGKRYYVESYNVYNIPLPDRIRKAKFLKYLPFMPKLEETENAKTLTDDFKKVSLGKTTMNNTYLLYALCSLFWSDLHCDFSCMVASSDTGLATYYMGLGVN